MTALPFLDSNIIVYAYSADSRSAIAKQILLEGATISVQVLNEFASVTRRKLGFDWQKINIATNQIIALCEPVIELSLTLQKDTRALAERYQFSIYDACIVAAALEAKCDMLYSEDMQDGMVIEGRLTIRNPFAA